jgi:hypothetical protein
MIEKATDAPARDYWPLSWWQIGLAVLLLAHSRLSWEWSLFPSTASRPFWDNFFNLGEFGATTLIIAAQFLAVGGTMTLAVKYLRGKGDAKSVFSWLLMIPATNLLILLVASVGIGSLWESELYGWLYFGTYPGAPYAGLTALLAILIAAAKRGGRLPWSQSIAVAIFGTLASLVATIAWVGWSPSALSALMLRI